MLPSGIILIWRNSIASIPGGWFLCDGNNGTPDLRDLFVVGAGGSQNPDDTGGQSTHQHTFSGDGHTHTIPTGPGLAIGTDFSNVTDSAIVTGTTDAGTNVPPFYALAYIMKS